MKVITEPYPLSRLYVQHILDIVRLFNGLGRGFLLESDGEKPEEHEHALAFYVPQQDFRIATNDHGMILEMNLKSVTYTYDHGEDFYSRAIHRVYDYIEEAVAEKRIEERKTLFRRSLIWYGLEVLVLGLYFWSQVSFGFALAVVGFAFCSFISRIFTYLGFSFFWAWFVVKSMSAFDVSISDTGLEYLVALLSTFLVSLWLHFRLEEWLEKALDD